MVLLRSDFMSKKSYNVPIPSWMNKGEIMKVKGGYKFRDRRYNPFARARGDRFSSREEAEKYQRKFRDRMLEIMKGR